MMAFFLKCMNWIMLSLILLSDSFLYSRIMVLSSRFNRGRNASFSCDGCRALKFTKSPSDVTVAVNDKVRLRCRVTGLPTPHVVFLWNGKPLSDIEPGKSVTVDKKNRRGKKIFLTISKARFADQGYYQCRAKNKYETRLSKRGFIRVQQPDTTKTNTERRPYSLSGPICILYNNSTCKSVLDAKRPIFSSSREAFLFKEKKLRDTYKLIMVKKELISKACRPFVLPLLCYTQFPYCTGNNNPVRTRLIQLCREDCLELQNNICKKEYEAAKADLFFSKELLPDCSRLPANNCIRLHSNLAPVNRHNLIPGVTYSPAISDLSRNAVRDKQTQIIEWSSVVDEDDNCFLDKGDDYRGTLNITEQQSKCKRWNETKFSFLSKKYPELQGGHNFCRNPGRIKARPWCYVDDGGMDTSEYCGIPKCALPKKVEVVSILWTIIPCLVFALALSLAIIIIAWRRHKQNLYRNPTSIPITPVQPRVNPKIPEIKREDLCDFRLMGEGNFGRVYSAEMISSNAEKTYSAAVAVKILIEKATNKQIEDFVREAETRVNFKHENVVAMIGVIMKEEPLCLVFEYTEFGDLHEHLLLHSPNFSGAHAGDDCEPLEFSDLVDICVQICTGMVFLSSQSFVHKDLATRNCLVCDNGIIKICDYSGLRDLYAGDYYRVPARTPIPVRWMCPESLFLNSYSSSTDVWSFGVLMWEVFSYGLQPHFGYSNQEVIERIQNGRHLPCPDGCSMSLFSIMKECWIEDQAKRHGFQKLLDNLKALNEPANFSFMNGHITPQVRNGSVPPQMTYHLKNGHTTSHHSVSGPMSSRSHSPSGNSIPRNGSVRSHSPSGHSIPPPCHSVHSMPPSAIEGHCPSMVSHPGTINPESLVSYPGSLISHPGSIKNYQLSLVNHQGLYANHVASNAHSSLCQSLSRPVVTYPSTMMPSIHSRASSDVSHSTSGRSYESSARSYSCSSNGCS